MVVVLPTGQLVTVFGHEVMVKVSVVRIVEVDGAADGGGTTAEMTVVLTG